MEHQKLTYKDIQKQMNMLNEYRERLSQERTHYEQTDHVFRDNLKQIDLMMKSVDDKMMKLHFHSPFGMVLYLRSEMPEDYAMAFNSKGLDAGGRDTIVMPEGRGLSLLVSMDKEYDGEHYKYALDKFEPEQALRMCFKYAMNKVTDFIDNYPV